MPPREIIDSSDIRKFMQVNLTCDGRIEFIPGSSFYQYFTIHFTRLGTELLGTGTAMLHQAQTGEYIMAVTDGVYSKSSIRALLYAIDGVDTQVYGETNTTTPDVAFETQVPVFTTADQRVKVSVGTHLPILSNVLINDEKQSSERDIAEAFFETSVTGEVRQVQNAQGAMSFETKVISTIYSGQCNMIRKHDSQHTWNKLLSSYRLRYMRFYLYITYRTYNETQKKYTLQKLPLVVDNGDYWQFSVRFVSES